MIVAVCVLSGCAELDIRAPRASKQFVRKPLVMHIQDGGPWSPSHQVTYDDRGLRYMTAPNFFDLDRAKATTIRPTKVEWDTFFRRLTELDVWSWKRSYHDDTMPAEGGWHIVIVYSAQGDYDVVSFGSTGPLGPTAAPPHFDEFWTVLQNLLGEHSFGS